MRRNILLILGLLLSACHPLSDTRVFYSPTVPQAYSPLPKNAVVPVVSGKAPWPSKAIGRFAMLSPLGYRYVYKAMVYNARRNGAEAVVLKKLSFDVRRTTNYIPPGWDSVPQTTVYYTNVQNNKGQWVTVPQTFTYWVPVYRPGRTYVNDVEWTDVVADMVVPREKQPSPAAPAIAR